HRLMDVDSVVRKGVSFCLASALVLVPGSFLHVALAREFGTHRPIALTCVAVAITLLAVILVPTLQAGLDMRVHRALFRHLHDSRRRLQELAGGRRPPPQPPPPLPPPGGRPRQGLPPPGGPHFLSPPPPPPRLPS